MARNSDAATRALKVRVRDKHAKLLREMAREVNLVWNYVNELSETHTRRTGKFFSGFDLDAYTKGASREFEHITADTIQCVNHEHARSRRQAKALRLRWRVSNPSSRGYSLGWVPFKRGCARFLNGQIKYAGRHFKVWDSYGLSGYTFRAGEFCEDATGRWYFCVAVDREVGRGHPNGRPLGVDLGVKSVAVASDGRRLPNPRAFKSVADKLAREQRKVGTLNKGERMSQRRRRRINALHRKAANQRRDILHKFSTRAVRDASAVYVGDWNVKSAAQTRLARSVMEAAPATLRGMLEYKSRWAGIPFAVVDEAYSTQTCSACGSLAGPKGTEGLAVREWECGDCGVTHDRDINAAVNILQVGHDLHVAAKAA